MSEESPITMAPTDVASDRSGFEASGSDWVIPARSAGIAPSSCGCSSCSKSLEGDRGLVFALGTIGYDLVSEARSDSIRAHMGASNNPDDPSQLLAYLEANPWEAASVTWTLQLDQTPVYAILPAGPFAANIYRLLAGFLTDQVASRSEIVSIPGRITGRSALRNGQVVDAVEPEPRGMYNWKTKELVDAAVGRSKTIGSSAAIKGANPSLVTSDGVANFLQRVYYELRNLGVTSEERAINFAATNAIKVADVFLDAATGGMELDAVSVERSPIGRPGSDCWDVKMMFFFPDRPAQAVRKSFRFTVDVSDVVPVMVGPVRAWSIR